MKTTFKITTLLLAAALPCAAIAAVAGFAEPATVSIDVVFPLFAIAGLQLVAMTDRGRRETIDLNAAPAVDARAALPRECSAFRRGCAAA